MKQKNLVRLLALLMLASPLTACGSGETTDTNDSTTAEANMETPAEVSAEDSEPVETERGDIADNLPESDFEGYEFRVITRDRQDFIDDIASSTELNGETVNDAYFYRNIAVADRFNVKFHTELAAPNEVAIHKAVEASVMADDDNYDLAANQCVSMAAVGTSGLYLEWNTQLPYVDLTKPWYIGNAAEAMSIKGRAYAMAGEYNMDIMRFTSCMYYNQDISEQYHLENIYSVVDEGRWTLDKLMSLADTVYEDTNGNGKKDEKDILAVSGDPFSAVLVYQWAFDNPIAKRDADGLPYLALDTEKANAIIVKLNKMYWDSIGGYTQGWGTGYKAWEAGNLLCLTGLFRDATTFGDLETDFSIIPYPKYDEAQTTYYSTSDGAHSLQSVPITVKDPEKISIIIEALNAETYKRVAPAYYEVALKGRYSRDEESARILDLLMDNRVFDFGFMFRETNIWQVYWNKVSTNNNDTASEYASLVPATQAAYEALIKQY